jgi:hypothetical protein
MNFQMWWARRSATAFVWSLLVAGASAQTAPAPAPEAVSPNGEPAESVLVETALIKEDPGETAFDPAAPSDAPPPDPAPAALSRGEEIAQFEAQRSRFDVTDEDAREHLNRYRHETRMRLWQF